MIDLHEYWQDPRHESERPENFVDVADRSHLLLELVNPLLDADAEILELGCGPGANLTHLHDNGYRNLTGIELNELSLELFEEHHPCVFADVDTYCGPVEDVLPNFQRNEFDVTVAVTVLAHLPEESEHVFDEMVRVTEDYIVVIENEESEFDLFVPRDYGRVFSERGCTQIAFLDTDEVNRRTELSDNCRARVFEV